MKPSMHHFTAADGTTLTVTTRVVGNELVVQVFAGKDREIARAEILTKAASHRTRV